MAMIGMGLVPEHHAQRKPDEIATVHGDDALSWKDLARGAARRANGLRRMGVETGDFVVFAMWNSNALIETAFAIWMAGGTPVPVPPKIPLPELKRVLDLAKPRVIIGMNPEDLPGWQVLPAGWTASGESEVIISVAPASYWKAIGSGGSTGSPKLIVSHRPALVDPSVYDVFDPSVHDGRLGHIDGSVVNPGPLYHNGPFNLVFNNMFVGSKLIGQIRFDAEGVLRDIEMHHGELLYMVPAMMHRIWKLPEAVRTGYDLSSLRGVLHLGAACPGWLKRAWIDWLGAERIFEAYGSTEAIGSTFLSGPEWLDHPDTVGRFQGYTFTTTVRILDDERNDVAPGKVGELFFLPNSGKGSTYHYIGAEPRSEGDFESVGDMGWVDEDGYLHLADRRTDMILRGGSNIYPAEIEAAIEEHSDVATAIVIGMPDEELGSTVHAIVELWPTASQKVVDSDLATFLRERLAGYKIPSSWEFSAQPLRDEAGKARRSALRAARVPAPTS